MTQLPVDVAVTRLREWYNLLMDTQTTPHGLDGFDMRTLHGHVDGHECRTVACAAGYAMHYQPFNEAGLLTYNADLEFGPIIRALAEFFGLPKELVYAIVLPLRYAHDIVPEGVLQGAIMGGDSSPEMLALTGGLYDTNAEVIGSDGATTPFVSWEAIRQRHAAEAIARAAERYYGINIREEATNG